MSKTLFKVLILGVFLASTTFVATAQDPTPETPPAGTGQQRPGGAGGAGGATTDPQPYDKVITKDAKTKKGIFTVHQVKDKYY